jgi:hypothetical protein
LSDALNVNLIPKFFSVESVANDRLNHDNLLLALGIAASVLAQILQSKSTLITFKDTYCLIDEMIFQHQACKKSTEEINF